jgi:hypothetical protein
MALQMESWQDTIQNGAVYISQEGTRSTSFKIEDKIETMQDKSSYLLQ